MVHKEPQFCAVGLHYHCGTSTLASKNLTNFVVPGLQLCNSDSLVDGVDLENTSLGLLSSNCTIASPAPSLWLRKESNVGQVIQQDSIDESGRFPAWQLFLFGVE
jgi:hypothetical protein